MYLSIIIVPFIILALLGWKWKLPLYFLLIVWLFSGVLSSMSMGLTDQRLLQIFIAGMVTIAILAVSVLIRFYRDPERTVPDRSDIVLCPADGIIRYIRNFGPNGLNEVEKKGREIQVHDFLHEISKIRSGINIGIEMRILDVHVNRAPISGTIKIQKRVPGPFKSLRNMSGILENERVISLIQNQSMQCIMIQIASRLVRRIVSYQDEGERVQKGQRIGMIRFGSQVDLLIPETNNLDILIKEGNTVKAGETILATYG